MSFHHADDHIFAAALAADALAEHVVGFAYSRRVAEEKFEDALFFLRSGFFQPLLRRLGHERYFLIRIRKSARIGGSEANDTLSDITLCGLGGDCMRHCSDV